MGQSIAEAFPGSVAINMRVGRSTSFEISLNGEVIHSKLSSGSWPDTKTVVQEISKKLNVPVAANWSATTVPSCAIL